MRRIAGKRRNTWDGGEKIVTRPVSGRLTREFFMGIEEGRFIVSRGGPSPMQPCFAEYTVVPPKREAQWQRICASGAHNIPCYVFDSKEDYDAYFAPVLEGHVWELHRD